MLELRSVSLDAEQNKRTMEQVVVLRREADGTGDKSALSRRGTKQEQAGRQVIMQEALQACWHRNLELHARTQLCPLHWPRRFQGSRRGLALPQGGWPCWGCDVSQQTSAVDVATSGRCRCAPEPTPTFLPHVRFAPVSSPPGKRPNNARALCMQMQMQTQPPAAFCHC